MKMIVNILNFVYLTLRNIYYRIFLLVFSLYKIDNRKIIIVNYSGKGYGDMGKYICNELIKYKNRKIYWATTNKYKNTLPEKVNYVQFASIKYLYHLATAKIWINNGRFSLGVRKRNQQFYIQTWHGCFALKKVEAALGKELGYFSVLAAKNDSKMANLFVSNSIFCTNFYKSYFWYTGDILQYGCPRNDVIINEDKDSIERVKKYFGFSDFEKICLYAPTFRENSSLNAYNLGYEILLNELKNKFKGVWKILVRLHPDISDLSNQLVCFNENVIDATDYPDIQELLVAADFMITDYSSCIFDYALSKKPAMIYASDIEDYKKDRDFEIKLEDAPFPIAINNVVLRRLIKNYNIEEYRKKLSKFYDNMGLNETGKSCQKIAEVIDGIISGKSAY